ncbi:CAMK/CAMKL/GIN4 protein kinase [Kwoniella heveanensis BCC8398]|uniref:non-specific serine/threonine protein kinase n=1 Tax=Kwoniella heveanensis BCC8398 TaxID=1296120 RepID=A0A1B9GZT3_9TREE|nr:CAMK/CAMKL/GIN4 protein kinase [Kwoniella heveanensis BCC8398]
MADSTNPPTPSPPRVRHSQRRGQTRFEKEAAATGGKAAADHPGDPKVIGPWRIGRTIGKGASGRVKIAKHSKTGQYAAIKIVPKHALLMSSRMSITEAGAKHDKAVLGIEREIVIMKLIDHPNVMSLYDVWETAKELYLVLEYVEGGELFDYLVSQGRLPPDEASRYFQQIVAGVDYCHRFNICHRDLKPENLLLDAERNIKIADFGMAALEPSDKLLETSCGSPHYASPEIVAGMSYHGAASDIWSCGVILFALLTGRLPFDDENIRILLQKVKNGRFVMPTDLPADAKDLITRMLVVDPEKRITMNEIMRHPFCQRKQDTDSGRRINLVEPPRLEEIARPVKSEREIDRDILRNLRTLWNGTSEREIVKSLLSNEKTWEKAFYFLLLQYRNKHLENFNPEPESRRGTTERRRRSENTSSSHRRSTRSTTSSTAAHGGSTIRKAVPREERERERNSQSHTQADKENANPAAHVATRPAPAPLSLHKSHATPGARVAGPRPSPSPSPSPNPDLRDRTTNGSARGTSSVTSPRTPAHLDKVNSTQPSIATPVDPRLPKITLQRPTPDAQAAPGPTGLGLNINVAPPPSPSPAPSSPPLGMAVGAALGNINVPQVQDAALQKFFHDIAEQLQLIGSASPRSSLIAGSPLASPAISQGETITTPTTPNMDLPPVPLPQAKAQEQPTRVQQPVIAINNSMQANRPAPLRSITEPQQPNTAPRPEVSKRRSYLGDATNRDNVYANQVSQPQRHSIGFEKVRKVSGGSESKRKSKPAPLDLSPRIPSELLSPVGSPYLSTPPLGGSAPPSPLLVGSSNEVKTSWFSNLFSWKPATFTLISADDCASSRAECIKLLESFGASVILEDADGWGVLKCRVDEIRGITIPKSVRFRIEFLPHAVWSTTSPHHNSGAVPGSPNPRTGMTTTSMTMVQEKGALSSFRAVYGRIRAEWRLDSLKSPAISTHSRFTTSPLASPAMSTDQAHGMWT